MSAHLKPKKTILKFRLASPEETFLKNKKKAAQARTERPPADFGAAEMGFGAESMQENDMKKIRIIREEVEQKFQVTLGQLKQIINEEIEMLEEAVNDDAPVKAVQAALNMLGYPQDSLGRPLKVDGVYGKNTHDTVVKFQASQGLAQDGRVGPNTAKEIQRALGAQPVGAPESGEEEGTEFVTDLSGMTQADADEWLKKNAEIPAGRKPVDRKTTPESYVDNEIAEKIEAAATNKERFSSPFAAGAALKLFADEGDKELLAALRDMVEREGRRVKQKVNQIRKNRKRILGTTSDRNKAAQRQAFADKIKADSEEMAQRLQIAALSPTGLVLRLEGKELNEQLSPSGNEDYTLNVVDTLMQKIRDTKMVLRRRRRKKAKSAEKPAVSAPSTAKTAVGSASKGDDTPAKPMPKLISKSEIASIAKYLSSEAFGQFGYPSSSKEDPKDTSTYAKKKVPGAWEKAKSDIDRAISAAQIKDLAVAYKKEEGDELMKDILYWLNQAKKQTGSSGYLDSHVKHLKKIYDTTRSALNKHDSDPVVALTTANLEENNS